MTPRVSDVYFKTIFIANGHVEIILDLTVTCLHRSDVPFITKREQCC